MYVDVTLLSSCDLSLFCVCCIPKVSLAHWSRTRYHFYLFPSYNHLPARRSAVKEGKEEWR